MGWTLKVFSNTRLRPDSRVAGQRKMLNVARNSLSNRLWKLTRFPYAISVRDFIQEYFMEAKAILKIRPLTAVPSRKSLGQHVFENLKQAIVRGDIPSEERLVESVIADALDISRTPVREAIHKLEREGFLKKLPRGGFTVVGLTREDIQETFGIRSVLESYAARLATIKHKTDELIPLEEKVDEYKKFLNRGKLNMLPKINTEFHDLLYTLSRSPKLVKMISALSDQIYRFRQIILKDRKMAEVSHKDHRQMLDAIRERNAEGVEKLVRAHILRGQEAVLKEFDRQINESDSDDG
jgi:DNA-binding GntR family transcriptional regulator